MAAHCRPSPWSQTLSKACSLRPTMYPATGAMTWWQTARGQQYTAVVGPGAQRQPWHGLAVHQVPTWLLKTHTQLFDPPGASCFLIVPSVAPHRHQTYLMPTFAVRALAWLPRKYVTSGLAPAGSRLFHTKSAVNGLAPTSHIPHNRHCGHVIVLAPKQKIVIKFWYVLGGLGPAQSQANKNPRF